MVSPAPWSAVPSISHPPPLACSRVGVCSHRAHAPIGGGLALPWGSSWAFAEPGGPVPAWQCMLPVMHYALAAVRALTRALCIMLLQDYHLQSPDVWFNNAEIYYQARRGMQAGAFPCWAGAVDSLLLAAAVPCASCAGGVWRGLWHVAHAAATVCAHALCCKPAGPCAVHLVAAAGLSKLQHNDSPLDEPVAHKRAHVHAQASRAGSGTGTRASQSAVQFGGRGRIPMQRHQSSDRRGMAVNCRPPFPPPRCRSYATVLNATGLTDAEKADLIWGAPLDERNRSTADVYCASAGRS